MSQWGHDFRPQYKEIGNVKVIVSALSERNTSVRYAEQAGEDLCQGFKGASPNLCAGKQIPRCSNCGADCHCYRQGEGRRHKDSSHQWLQGLQCEPATMPSLPHISGFRMRATLSGSDVRGITVTSAVHRSMGDLCTCAGELFQEQSYAAGCAKADRENPRGQPCGFGSTCWIHPVSRPVPACAGHGPCSIMMRNVICCVLLHHLP